MNRLTLALTRHYLGVVAVLAGVAATAGRRSRDERGDVPGWVLITVMTAGLVTIIWGVARDELTSMLRSALNSVTG